MRLGVSESLRVNTGTEIAGPDDAVKVVCKWKLFTLSINERRVWLVLTHTTW